MKLRLLLRKIKSTIATELNLPQLYGQKSYSQEGEDLILQKIFHGQRNGFYVDVGAHHPFRYSNTQLLHQQGWSGINVEPAPNAINLFQKTRKHDINLNVGISKKEQKLKFYQFVDGAVNTFSTKRAQQVIRSKQSELIQKITIKTIPLRDILQKYLPTDTDIDLMNIDVEGLDLEVLKSNDWNKFQPHVIVIEQIDSENQTEKYLKQKGYTKIAQTINTHFYKR